MFGENVSLIRYWTDYFRKFLKPVRNAKGNRMYTSGDIDVLRQIYLLVRKNRMTLEGAACRMTEDRKSIESRVKAVESLKLIRAQLEEIRRSL